MQCREPKDHNAVKYIQYPKYVEYREVCGALAMLMIRCSSTTLLVNQSQLGPHEPCRSNASRFL